VTDLERSPTRWSNAAALKPLRGVGGFAAMALDTFVAMFRWPFAWREFLEQTWFVARVSLVPTLLLSIPFVVLAVFTFNVLLVEIRRGRPFWHRRRASCRQSDRALRHGFSRRRGRSLSESVNLFEAPVSGIY
jgi:hypothetical protein